MNDIISFIQSNWISITLIVLFNLVELVILIFKKPFKIDDIKARIFDSASLVVAFVEKLSQQYEMSSSEKLNTAIAMVRDQLHLDSSFNDLIANSIEKLLSTPSRSAGRENYEK